MTTRKDENATRAGGEINTEGYNSMENDTVTNGTIQAWNGVTPLHPAIIEHGARFQSIPHEMRQYPQWCCWKKVWDDKAKKWKKMPKSAKHLHGWGSSTDKTRQGTYAEALAMYCHDPDWYDGIGFCFFKDDPLAFLDVDDSYTNGQYSDLALETMQRNPSWSELSQSGEGIHIIGKADGLGAKTGGMELYLSGRFVALTGNQIPNTPITLEPIQEGVDWFRGKIKAAGGKESSGPADKPTDALTSAVWRTGLVKMDKGGKLEMDCPFADDHTDPGDAQGAVFMPAHCNYHPRANFFCQHAHCSGRTIRDLEAYLIEHDDEYRKYATPFAEIPDGADPMSIFDQYELSQVEVDAIKKPEWVIEDLIIRGHVSVWPARPGGGKTTLFVAVAGWIADEGKYNVRYITADASGGDVQALKTHSDEHGYRLVLPDFKSGKTIKDVMKNLEKLAEGDHDLSSEVMFFDTLKKITNVMSKGSVKDTMKLLRKLSAMGMTIIILAHANKYLSAEGMPIFEGVGDVQSDSDELIYLTSKKQEDGGIIISTVCHADDGTTKVRGDFKNASFKANRKDGYGHVTRLGDYADVRAEIVEEKREAKDSMVIAAITDAMQQGQTNQIGIITFCKTHHSVGKNVVLAALNHYTLKKWTMVELSAHNAHEYQLMGLPGIYESPGKPEPAPLPVTGVVDALGIGNGSRAENS